MPRNDPLWLTSGIKLYNDGRFEEAVPVFREALRGRSADARALPLLAHSLSSLGRRAEAIAVLKKGLKDGVGSSPVFIALATLLEEAGKTKEAAAYMRRAAEAAPDSVDVKIQLGKSFLKRGLVQKAEKQFRAALALDGNSIESRKLLARTLETRGALHQAESMLRAAAEAARSPGPELLDLGEFYLRTGKFDQAETVISRALGNKRIAARAHVLIGSARLSADMWDTAAESFREAVRIAPESLQARRALKDYLQRRQAREAQKKKAAEAEALKQKILAAHIKLAKDLEERGRLPEAEAELRKMAAGAPLSRTPCFHLGEFLYRHGKQEAAQQSLAAAAALEGPDGAAHILLSEIFLSRGDQSAAISILQKGTLRHPDDPLLFFRLGRLHWSAGRDEPMRAAFEKFLEIENDSPGGEIQEFLALTSIGLYEKAFARAEKFLDAWSPGPADRLLHPWEEDAAQGPSGDWRSLRLRELTKVAHKQPDSPWAPFFIGILFLGDKRVRAGRAKLDSLKIHSPTRYGWMRFPAGASRLEHGDSAGAIEDFEAVLASRPDAWWARCALAEAHAATGETAKAMKIFDDAERRCRTEKDLANVLAWRGEIRLWVGDLERAIEDLDRAIWRGCFLAFCWRGAAHRLAGRPEQALSDFNSALNKNPGDSEALIWRGGLFREHGRQHESLADLDLAVESGRGHWAHVERGLTRAKDGDEAGLWEDFERVPEEIVSLAEKKLGRKPGRDYDTTGAVRIMETALELAGGVRRSERHILPLLQSRVHSLSSRPVRHPG